MSKHILLIGMIENCPYCNRKPSFLNRADCDSEDLLKANSCFVDCLIGLIETSRNKSNYDMRTRLEKLRLDMEDLIKENYP